MKPFTPTDIAKARKLRAEGWSTYEVAARLRRNQATVYPHVKDVKPSPIAQRAALMVRRGFDVPPSKQTDFDTLRQSGFKLAEIKEALRLE